MVLTPKCECYGLSKPQDGRKHNEDAFLLLRGTHPIVALCDGAGDAEQVAKKALNIFRTLVQNASGEELIDAARWQLWTRQLDMSLAGGHQSTFTACAVVGNRLCGVNVGDNRVYRFDSAGAVTIPSNGSSKPRLGSGEAKPFFFDLTVQRKEIVAIMSDGAWGPLTLPKIAELFRKRLSIHPADLPEAFLAAASRYGRGDDMTVVNVYT